MRESIKKLDPTFSKKIHFQYLNQYWTWRFTSVLLITEEKKLQGKNTNN